MSNPSQVPALLSQVDHRIDWFIGDGMYDQEPVYAAVEDHSLEARGIIPRGIIPPRKEAVLSSRAKTAPTQRDQHVLAIESAGRFAWKRTSGYYAQAYAENVFARFKRTFGDRLRAKRDEAQERKPRWLASCSIGCGNWVALSLIRSAESGVRGLLLLPVHLCNKPRRNKREEE